MLSPHKYKQEKKKKTGDHHTPSQLFTMKITLELLIAHIKEKKNKSFKSKSHQFRIFRTFWTLK